MSTLTVGKSTCAPSVVFIGAGNVASHLAPAIETAGIGEIKQVYSRTIDSARALASRLNNAQPVDNIEDIITDADIYVVSLVDHAVKGLIGRLPHGDALWLHTSGSLPMSTLSTLSPRYGVLYPLQTFSRDVDVDMSRVPMFVEGSSPEVEAEVYDLARHLSETVHYADGDLRARMHVAAVFACNFTNHMFTIADDLLHRDNLDLSVLYPLIEETVRKALRGNPASGQTGPAVRGDNNIVNRHASTLPPDLSKLYLDLSDSIYRRHHKGK